MKSMNRGPPLLCDTCAGLESRATSGQPTSVEYARYGCATRMSDCPGARLPACASSVVKEKKVACVNCRQGRRGCRALSKQGACVNCVRMGRQCSFVGTRSWSAEGVVTAALLQLLAPPRAALGLQQNALSSSLSYHLFQVFSVHNPELIQLSVPVCGGFLSIGLQVAQVRGKTREMNPLSEILTLCCVLQAARISTHSSIIGFQRYTDRPSYLDPLPKNQGAVPINLGLVRQPAVQAVRQRIKQRLMTLLEDDCTPFFECQEGRTVLSISLISLHDQGGYMDALEVGALAYRRAESKYRHNKAWQSVLSGPMRQFLGVYISMVATHPLLCPLQINRSTYLQIFSPPEALDPFPAQDETAIASFLRGSPEGTGLIPSTHRANLQRGSQVLPYLLYDDNRSRTFKKNWTVVIDSCMATQSTFCRITAHPEFAIALLGPSRERICTGLLKLADEVTGFLFPVISACYRKCPGVTADVEMEMTEVLTCVVRFASQLWDLRHHYSPWQLYEYFSDSVAVALWHARGEILDNWRRQCPSEAAMVMPALNFASIFSAHACALYTELGEALNSIVYTPSSTAFTSMSDEIVEEALSDLQ